MKVLLDENLPHRLRLAIEGHDVFTAKYMGWAGVKNGRLLALIEEHGFDVFITADQAMRGQQNFSNRKIATICLTAQEWPLLSFRVKEILGSIDAALPGSVRVVDCGEFQR